MKIAFHGAARTVTGSKHVITLNNGKKILLDCGMFQGLGDQTDELNHDFGFDPKDITAMILSHAHIDHTGLIPKLVKEGFTGKIFCTPATHELTNVLLQDSAKIQEDEVKYSQKGGKFMHGEHGNRTTAALQPLYTTEDATLAMQNFVSVEYDTPFPVFDGVTAQFSDAGHIIGSACVHVKVTENGKTTRLTFSGDVGTYHDEILRSPAVFDQADYIVMESTYGNSLHDRSQTTPDVLLEWINKTCLQKKGKLIMPAFSVGRTQELLYSLNQLELEKRLPDLPYYVDSPLSIQATEIVKKYPKYFNRTIQQILETDDDPFAFKGLKYINTPDESKQLNFQNGPMVIISASGMADAGRVKHHISNNIENSNNSILFTGFCEPHSLGGLLTSGAKEVSIYGVRHEVHAAIGSLRSMSAHGDYQDLCQWLACQDPRGVKKLFLVHGDYDVQLDFKQRLIKKDFFDVEIPERHYEIGLN